MTDPQDKRNPKEIFKSYCEKNGMRYTPERDVIIEEIYRKEEHFDIDNLFLRLRNRYTNIRLAKGSIYRTLPHLIKAGLLRLSFTDQGHMCYERTIGHKHHDHMKCLGCGLVLEFLCQEIEDLQESMAKKLKFKIIWQLHVLSGYCEKCLKEKSH